MTATVLQLTDCHVGAQWGGDPPGDLRSVIAAIDGLPQHPEAVLVTGDRDLLDHPGLTPPAITARQALEQLGL